MSKFIFSILCTFTTPTKRTCWPAIPTIAELANVSKSTVKRALNELEMRGVILRKARFNDNGRTSSEYLIIGHEADCYKEVSLTGEPTPVSPMNQKGYHMNNNNYSKEGGDLPSEIQESKTLESNPKKKPDSDNKNQTHESSNKAESIENRYLPEDAPEVMKSVASYMLYRTNRDYLSWNEISSLRTLAAIHVPNRVQNEIDRACERFERQNKNLRSLRFEYIEAALKNQPSTLQKVKEARAKKISQQEDIKPQELQANNEAETENLITKIEELKRELKEKYAGLK